MLGWISCHWGLFPVVFLVGVVVQTNANLAATEQIPIEQCDRLPVIVVSVEGRQLRFLVDTAATSMLNIKSFAGGSVTAIQVTSWKGTSLTSAREVTLPEFVLGNHRLHNLSLPAIDLGPIAEACGGRIDGILGVDLLEEMGATLDLRNRVAHMGEDREKEETASLEEFRASQATCLAAFNRGDTGIVAACLDPRVALFTTSGEIRGQEAVIDYFRRSYFDVDPPAQLDLEVRDSRFLGDAVWFGYDLEIALPEGLVEAKGMAICRQVNGRWRLLSMHNSFEAER